MSHRIIFSISSDFGFALAKDWLEKGFQVSGTYNTPSAKVDYLLGKGATLVKTNFLNKDEIDIACEQLSYVAWDVLCLAPATLNPIGKFVEIEIDEWEKSIYLNFISQMRAIHRMDAAKNTKNQEYPIILLFAGGGTNSATNNYSAYTVSKIAQIKMAELLDSELRDTRITIIGPGWVKTKIHNETINAGKKAGENYTITKEKLSDISITSLEDVVDCCNWAIACKKEVISGRNISLVYDSWRDEEFGNYLLNDSNLFKLRRFGNI
jgi:NAD(P)-dependent dehydrogenase (short-subunit alcohol dehydrogenase family)